MGSASYFNGDFDDHRDMAYALYTGATFPTPVQKQPSQGGSRDVSHYYRIPILFRSLYDNRKATGNPFPQTQDIQLLVNQYLYRVFNGNFDKPLFKNFFDGNDGWYRVGYHGKTFGYPPSIYADKRLTNRPGLALGAIRGWGLLAPFSEDLTKLQKALLVLAASQEPSIPENFGNVIMDPAKSLLLSLQKMEKCSIPFPFFLPSRSCQNTFHKVKKSAAQGIVKR